MLDLRDSENSNWIKNVGQQDEDEEIEKSSSLLTLQDWLDKATSKQELAMEARRKGLIPQSGNWMNPRKWIIDPKLHSLRHDEPYHQIDGGVNPQGSTYYHGWGTRSLEESPSSRKILDEGAVSYSKPSRAERRLRGKILGDILSSKKLDSTIRGSKSEGWDTKDVLTVSEKKAFLEEVTNTLLKFVPSTHLKVVKSLSLTERLRRGVLDSGRNEDKVLAQCGRGHIGLKSTKRWKTIYAGEMGQVVIHEIGHALHQAWSEKFYKRLEEEIEIASNDSNIDEDIYYGLDELKDEIDSLWNTDRFGSKISYGSKMRGIYLGEYHKGFVKEFNRAKRMEAGFPSEYSKRNVAEFFAETYATYLQSPESLKQRNPATYKLMRGILSSFDNDTPITQDNVREHLIIQKQLEEAEQYHIISDPAGVGDFEEGLPDLSEEEDEDSVAMFNEWLDKQSHNDLRPMNPPSRPPHKGAVWNSNSHRWSKAGTADLDKQDSVSSIAEAKRRGLVPQSGDWKQPRRWVLPKDADVPVEDNGADGESDVDREKKAKSMTQPKGATAQKLKKFNDNVGKVLKLLDDLIGGHVDNPQQTFEDLEHLKGEVDQDIEDANTKIDENEGKLDDLHNSGKIDDETEEKALKELEELRKYYEEQEKTLGKLDEDYEKLREKLSLEEESAGDEEEEKGDEEIEEEIEEETEEETEEDEGDETEEPTVDDNAQTLLDRTTKEIDELKETRKEIERQQKLLERKLKEAGDDEESRKKIIDQLSDSKNRVDTMNTSLQTQMRKLEMAKSILTKKPSLNGATQEE